MPVDYYVGKNEAQLLELLGRLQDALATGQLVTVTAAGVTTTRQVQSVAQIERQIFNVRYSLYLRAPETYDNPQTERITQTAPNYNA